VLGVGGQALVAPAVVGFEYAELRPRVWAFPADQDPHLLRPPSSGETRQQPGQLSDLRDRQPRLIDRTGFTCGVDRDRPRGLGQHSDGVLQLVGQGEPDRELDLQAAPLAQRPDMRQPCLGGAGAVGADQDRCAIPIRVGDLRQCLLGHADVVGGGIGVRVPGPQHPGQRLPGVVQPGEQRVIAEPVLEGWRTALFLRMAGHQGGVQVDHQARHDRARAPYGQDSTAGFAA
jgi:hypothetical protein